MRARLASTGVLLAVLSSAVACGPKPSVMTVVLFDVSSSTDSQTRAQYMIELNDVVLPAVRAAQGRVAIQLINDNPYGSDSLKIVELPRCGLLDNALACSSETDQRLAELIGFLASHLRDADFGTDVVGALDSAARVLQAAAAGQEKRLIIFSDLLQRVGGLSIAKWAQGPSPDISDVLSRLGTSPDGLAGTSVYISGVGIRKSEDLPSEAVRRVLDAWTAYFVAADATVRSTTPDLPPL